MLSLLYAEAIATLAGCTTNTGILAWAKANQNNPVTNIAGVATDLATMLDNPSTSIANPEALKYSTIKHLVSHCYHDAQL